MANERPMLTNILAERNTITSSFLEREVLIDAYLPLNIVHPEKMSLLLINDGQDLPGMPFNEILSELFAENEITPLLCIGIHCSAQRRMEYGVANHPDFKGRGAKANLYTNFIFRELLPFIKRTYRLLAFKEKSFAGFSLGGLSALDIAWNHPLEFSKVGVFSGSLWWRSIGYKEGYNEDTDRIMHQQIQNGKYHSWLKFFFQCGELDEKKDRNNNGIIDSIDDTLDLIKELKQKGYTDDDIYYLKLSDGKHDVPTWASAFPEFLKWGWGR
ncbi:MAG: alpha/beta hydrolase-fold protein [Parafilimonas sp.]